MNGFERFVVQFFIMFFHGILGVFNVLFRCFYRFFGVSLWLFKFSSRVFQGISRVIQGSETLALCLFSFFF